MSYYFEMPEAGIKKGFSEYASAPSDSAGEYSYRSTLNIMYYANRVWKGHANGKIELVKNRTTGTTGPLDNDHLKEFMWVKLLAESVN